MSVAVRIKFVEVDVNTGRVLCGTCDETAEKLGEVNSLSLDDRLPSFSDGVGDIIIDGGTVIRFVSVAERDMNMVIVGGHIKILNETA
jgi:hypothetical protein